MLWLGARNLMAFITEDFLLQNTAAKRLYHTFAEDQPILDYHCHLPPASISENRQFRNLFEIWLEGDHYKWRAMRANGVDERYCTGDASPLEKFLAWAATVPHTLRNPLYHWTHLELLRYFGIDELLDEGSARRIWERANAELATEGLRAQGILKRFRVTAVCTTDDPADDLSCHQAIRASRLRDTSLSGVPPGQGADRASTGCFQRLGGAAGSGQQHGYRELAGFYRMLCGSGTTRFMRWARGSRTTASTTATRVSVPRRLPRLSLTERAQGQPATAEEHEQFASYMMLLFGHLDAEKGWTKQLHLGAYRNANTRRLAEAGPDTGFDSIGDWPQANTLGAYLDHLERDNALPKIILYNVNPVDNYTLATMIGNFQDGKIAGKIQFGSGWWYLDQKEGMEWQLNALSNTGLLSRFVGMLTDSRSFMSYPRHEYFRRVLCNLIGRDMEDGLIPNSDELVGPMIRNICYRNAHQYLGLDIQTGLGVSQ